MIFLLHEPPSRSREQVGKVLGQHANGASGTPPLGKPLNIVLVASKQDHGPGQHDYPAWQTKWIALLGQAPGVTATEAWEWPTGEQWRKADVVVFYFWNHDWSAERYRQLDDYQARGGGVVVFHSATIADKEPEKLAERIGLAAQPGPTKYLHTPVMLNFVAPTNQVITRGFKQLDLLDEPYWPMFASRGRKSGSGNKAKAASLPALWAITPGLWTIRYSEFWPFAASPGPPANGRGDWNC